MREPVREVVAEMVAPDATARDAALAKGGSQAVNDRLQASWPCLNSIEARPPAAPLPTPSSLTIAAWNIERCKRVEDSAELIRASGADVVLATEMDHGMARSGQRHTARDLAAMLGFGYIFGTEFVELGTGDDYETSLFAGEPNRHGLHGNAILSRYPLLAPALIPVEDGGFWFTATPKADGQLRIGGRMAMAARVETTAGPVTLAAVHYESESDADGRAEQTARLIAGLDRLFGPGACVVGGDLNTRAFSDAGWDRGWIFERPEDIEPTFSRFRIAGFDWCGANTGAPTTRAAPGRPVTYPLKTLDWLFIRGLAASAPRVLPAVSARGDYLSDHEMIVARIVPWGTT